jgi:hypothetical protein
MLCSLIGVTIPIMAIKADVAVTKADRVFDLTPVYLLIMIFACLSHYLIY